MALITFADVDARYRASFSAQEASAVVASASAETYPLGTKFDVFLCHSYLDKKYVLGLREMLKQYGKSVYVDWICDPLFTRETVNRTTANRLRRRMRDSKDLFYATSPAADESRWMPWELGYFDGMRPRHVALVPIVPKAQLLTTGQEYLDLYPTLERLNLPGKPLDLRIVSRDRKTFMPLKEFAVNGMVP
jgi:hypothetical protein